MYLDGEERGSAKIFHVRFVASQHNESVGTISSDGKSMKVACSDGWVEIHELQVAGKRRMATRDLLLGFRDIDRYNCQK